MSITVRFFASLREQVGKSELTLEQPPATVADVWAATAGIERPGNTLAAVNHDYVAMDTSVNDGDEVAFFPPVTGG